MKHLAAYLLLNLGGNASPSAKDVKAVLSAVGIEADDERLNTLISELKDKDVNEVWRYRRHFECPEGTHSMLTCFNSSSPLAPRSWPPSPRVVLVVPPLPVVLLLPAAPLPSLPLRRSLRRRRSPMRIWASVCSTKRFLTRSLHGYEGRFFPGKDARRLCGGFCTSSAWEDWSLMDGPSDVCTIGILDLVHENDNSLFFGK